VVKGGKHGGAEFYTRERLSGIAASLQKHLRRRSSPSIVFILADDLGYGDLSCYGAKRVETPNIDRLAKEGRRFTDAHSPHSVCTPTRYSLLTGRYAWRTWNGSGTLWSNDPLLIEEDRPTIASLLKSAGYATACIGKWHLGFGSPSQPGWDDLLGPDYNRALKPGPLECGFDRFFGIPHVGQLPHVYIRDHHVVGVESLAKPMRLVLDPNPVFHKPYLERPRHIGKVPWHTFENIETISYEHEELGLRLTQEAVNWIGEQSPDQPFFLYFAHRNPHTPLRPNPKFLGSSKIGKYGDFLNELDWCVGQVLDALESSDLADQTLVVLSSDNGGIAKYVQMDEAVINGHHVNGPLRGQKTQAYEGGHRVPLLVRWPGKVAAGSTSDALVALTDVFATLAELTGQSVPRGAAEDSFSFLPHLLDRDAQSPPRESLVADGYLNVFSIRKGPWKLIQSQGGGGIRENPEDVNPSQPAGQLYHLGDDLSERDNLYSGRAEKVKELTDLLSKIRQSTR
jgi:arylsulfatase A-like enzyme